MRFLFTIILKIVFGRVFEIAGKEIIFYEGDITDAEKLTDVFQRHNFDGGLHFSGLKTIGESAAEPILYHENNVYGSLQLVKVMCRFDVKYIDFFHLRQFMVCQLSCR